MQFRGQFHGEAEACGGATDGGVQTRPRHGRFCIQSAALLIQRRCTNARAVERRKDAGPFPSFADRGAAQPQTGLPSIKNIIECQNVKTAMTTAP